jgi:hypothetical protein
MESENRGEVGCAMPIWLKLSLSVVLLTLPLQADQSAVLTFSPADRKQVIDGFGTCLSKELGRQEWFRRHTSSDGALWQESTPTADGGAAQVTFPGYSVTTLTAGY